MRAWFAPHGQRVRAFLAPVEPRWLVALSMALVVVGGLLLGGVARRGQSQLLASSQRMNHAMELEHLGRALLMHLSEAEQSVRTLVLSGMEEDALAAQAALARVPDDWRQLRTTAGSNPDQRPHLDQLELLVTQSVGLLENVQTACDAGNHETAFALLMTGHMPRVMEGIRAGTVLLGLEEQRALALRQQQMAAEAAANRGWLVFVALVTTLFVAVVLFVARRLALLRRLARVCAWSRTIEYQGEWLKLEDYLARRFNMQTTHGISPAEAEKMRSQLPTS
jgi:CHASE3 domain sensor protein